MLAHANTDLLPALLDPCVSYCDVRGAGGGDAFSVVGVAALITQLGASHPLLRIRLVSA